MKTLFSPVSLLASLLIVTVLSCDETTIVKNYSGTGEEKTYSIEGYAQKGPFIVGTDVTVSELSEDLYPTGRVFFATILNDEGYFELPGVVLASQYVQIKVRGRYFSETGGYVPTEELTLYSLADVTNSETINVNILTHLEKERVEYLVQEENKSFNVAKAQAKTELLKVFEWEELSVIESEHLSISDNDTGGAVLLAMSSIFEAIDFVARLKTITNFKTDFASDGILNSTDIQNKLLTSAVLLNKAGVRYNMETKYEVEMPDFESVLHQFIDNSSYTNYLDVIFPKTKNGYVNLFRSEAHKLNSSTNYAFIIEPFPNTIEVGKNFADARVNAYFWTPDNTYPSNILNNFQAASDERFNVFTHDISLTTCDSGGEATCYQVWVIGELKSNPVTSAIISPVSYVGQGTFKVSGVIDIDDVNYWYESGEFSW